MHRKNHNDLTSLEYVLKITRKLKEKLKLQILILDYFDLSRRRPYNVIEYRPNIR